MKKKLFIIAACVVCILGIFSCDWDSLASSSSSSSSGGCPSGGYTHNSYYAGSQWWTAIGENTCKSSCEHQSYSYNYYCWTGSNCKCYY